MGKVKEPDTSTRKAGTGDKTCRGVSGLEGVQRKDFCWGVGLTGAVPLMRKGWS